MNLPRTTIQVRAMTFVIITTNSRLLALAFFYAKLQAIAFDEPSFEPEKVADATRPLYDGIRKVSLCSVSRVTGN